MIPVRVTAPASPVVSTADLKNHLRVDFDDDDAQIEAFQNAVVAWLDGYRGILGRCIMPQAWKVEITCAGKHLLPFPDVTEVVASVGEASLSQGALGSYVTLTEPAEVKMTMQAPDDILPSIQVIVKLLVAYWYENREAAAVVSLETMPLAVRSLLTPIRWVRV